MPTLTTDAHGKRHLVLHASDTTTLCGLTRPQKGLVDVVNPTDDGVVGNLGLVPAKCRFCVEAAARLNKVYHHLKQQREQGDVATFPEPSEPSIWEAAVLPYISDRCGVQFTTLAQADEWLKAHPEHPLNRKAIRDLLRPDSCL
jgi:hypothetical protein